MKKNILLLILVFLMFSNQILFSQNVAINSTGNAPNSSAMLDVQSTTKGMLIPRMTTAQRTAIASPGTGLLVFDNTTGSFWFKSATKWVELTDNSDNTWTKNGSNVYVNNGENVGIGTNAADVRLEIDHGTDIANGTGGYLQLGAISNPNLAFDNNEIQARNNKAASALYIQNSGGDLQIGSSSGSSTNVHINNGKLVKKSTGNFNMMPLCYGHVSASGTLISGTPNVSVVKHSTGEYYINCAEITSSTIMTSTSNETGGGGQTAVYYYKPGQAILVLVYNGDDIGNGDFSFIFYNP